MSVVITKPVVERIGNALFKRLQLLAAGYSDLFRATEVIRPKRFAEYTPKNRQIVLLQGESEEVPELSLPGNPPAQCFSQIWNIYCHVLPSEKDPTPFDDYANTMAAEVMKVVTDANATSWQNWSGLAIDSNWLATQQVDADGGVDGVRQSISIMYRTDEGNPYSVRA